MVDSGDEPLRFVAALPSERRKVPRKKFDQPAMAVFATGLTAASLARVMITDASHTGMGFISPVMVEPGTSVSVMPEHPMWPRQTGIVVRCSAREDGTFAVGIMTRRANAAA